MLILEIAGILFTALVGMVIAYLVGRKQGLEKKTEDFRCLYCDTLVIGAKSADKMVHILCIDRAPEDIAALKQKAIAPEDEYFVDLKPVQRAQLDTTDNKANWKWTGSVWSSTQADLYRNDAKISSWIALDKGVLKNRMEEEIKLDKHKQKTKRNG